MSGKPVSNILAMLVMGLVLGGIALIFWAGEQRNASYGPTLLTEDTLGRIWVLADRRLMVADSDGRLLRNPKLESLGLDAMVNALAPLENGGVLAGSFRTGVLYVLDAEGRVEETLDPSRTSARGLPHGFALAYDAKLKHILVAHTGHHRVLVLDRSAGLVQQAGSTDGSAGQFNFPNDITMTPSRRIYVSDTNHHQIQILNEDLSAAGDPVPVPYVAGALWPVSVAVLPDGRMAVVTLNGGMRKGQALLLAADGKLLQTLKLQAGAEPASVLARSDDLLVTDQSVSRYQIARFSHDGTAEGFFGDASFQAALDGAAKHYRQYTQLRQAGQGLAAIAALLLILLYTRERRAKLKHADQSINLPPVPVVTPRMRLEFTGAIVLSVLPFSIIYILLRTHHVPHKFLFETSLATLFVMTLAMLVLFRFLQSPRFAPIVAAQTASVLRTKLKRLPDWDSGEQILAYARVSRGRQAYFLVLTRQRLLLIPILGALSSRVEDALALTSIRRAEFRAAGGWKSWLSSGKAQELVLDRSETGADSWLLTIMNPAELATLRTELEDCLRNRGSSESAAVKSAQPKPTLVQRPLWSSLLLSLLLPGLGHLNQQRNEEGLKYLIYCGVLGTLAGLELFVHVTRVSQIDVWHLYKWLAVLAVYWIWAFADVLRYSQRQRRVAEASRMRR